jgi:hypothetical protein
VTALVPSEIACLESSPLGMLAVVDAIGKRVDLRKDQSDRGLDLTRRDGRSVVVRGELGCLGSDTLEDVGNKRVEDGHGLVAEDVSE